MNARLGFLTLAMVLCASAFQQATAQSPLSISGTAFNPNDPSCIYSRDGYSGVLIDNNNCTYDAAVFLPQNVYVTRLQISYDSSNADESSTLHFERNDITFGHVDLVAASLPSGQFAPKTNVFNLCHKVSNTNSHYGLWLAPDAGFAVFRVKITYQTAACTSPSRELPGSNGPGRAGFVPNE